MFSLHDPGGETLRWMQDDTPGMLHMTAL